MDETHHLYATLRFQMGQILWFVSNVEYIKLVGYLYRKCEGLLAL